MTTRIVEGQLPYTGGTGIGIDTNKVISILLREENNLIEVNGDNELYTDLQLAVNITPSSDFPVGVTVGKVLAENGWSQNGLILNWKTTSGDYARWLYGADGKLYFDGGQGTWKQVYYSEEVDALFTALRGELATVAFSGDYNDLINRPAFLQVQADWDETDTDSPAYIKNKPTMPTVNDATLTIQKNGVAVGTFTANSSTNVTANITVPNVINNLTSTSTSDSLSAAQGKILNDKITDLQSIGRFLSLWDATTGLPISFPLDIPYNYRTGDYYLVETVGTSNKRPDGVQYTGTASTVPETDELEIGDMYIYDGQVWLLQINHGKSVSFANLSGQPSDNANLASALNAKANVADLATVATSGSYNDLTNKPTIPSAQVNSDWNATSGVAQILNKPTIPTKTSQLTNDSGYITSAYHDSSKQDVLSAGIGIDITNDIISNTGVTSINAGGNTINGDVFLDVYGFGGIGVEIDQYDSNIDISINEKDFTFLESDVISNGVENIIDNSSIRRPSLLKLTTTRSSTNGFVIAAGATLPITVVDINRRRILAEGVIKDTSTGGVNSGKDFLVVYEISFNASSFAVTSTDIRTYSISEVQISTQNNNILSSGAKLWAGSQSDYDNLGTYDNNTVYLTI